MSGAIGFIVGVVLFAVGLGGLAFALEQFMTHTDPNLALHAAAGIGTFVIAALASIAVIR
jgi:hypothetical protein